MSDTPEILTLDDVADNRYEVRQPAELPEGRDVVFSGLLLGQMLMASDRHAARAKDVRSVHTIFARAGVYSKPLELTVDPMQSGRTWGSDTVTATQDGRLLARSLVLLNTVEPDLMRHSPDMPAGVPGAEELAPGHGQVFPGGEWRPVPGEATVAGAPAEMAWHRFSTKVSSQAANQAILSWATCGNIIGLAFRAHKDKVSLADAHKTLSTGVISHTIHFLDRIDVSGWLLVVTQGTSAGNGRIYGGGSVYTPGGELVASFHQDSMAKQMDAGRPM